MGLVSAGCHRLAASDTRVTVLTRWNRLDGLLLAGLLVFILLRTVLSGNSATVRERSEATTESLQALGLTKTTYILQGQRSLPRSRPRRASDAAEEAREEAIKKWRALAVAKTGGAAEWRRLGITLFLFDKPGGREAFRRITNPPPSQRKKDPDDPFERMLPPVRVPPAEEVALWEAIYGSEPLTPQKAEALRPTLARLHLDWFENIAAARLYAKAGLHAKAARATADARAAARQFVQVSSAEVSLALFGALGLLLGVVVWFLVRYGTTPLAAQLARLLRPSTSPPVSSIPPTLGIFAFAFYLFLMLALSLPFSLVRSSLSDLSPVMRLRVGLGAQLLLYLPVVFFPLRLLRRGMAPRTTEGSPLSWRALLALVGLRAENPTREAALGVVGYALVFPLFLGVAALSAWLFRHFYTPMNPFQIQMLAMQGTLDKALLLLTAAVVGPLVEEMMFRGALYPALRARLGVFGGIVLSAALFSLVHPTLPAGFLPLWLLGAAFALMYEWRGSLLPCIVMHGLHNGLVLLQAFALLSR